MGINTMWPDKLVLFYAVSSEEVPVIAYGVTVHDDLSITIFIKDQNLPLKIVKNVCKSGKLESIIQLVEM